MEPTQLLHHRFNIFSRGLELAHLLIDVMFRSQLVSQIVQHFIIGPGNLIIIRDLGQLCLIEFHPLHEPVLDQDAFGYGKRILAIKIDIIAARTFLCFNF